MRVLVWLLLLVSPAFAYLGDQRRPLPSSATVDVESANYFSNLGALQVDCEVETIDFTASMREDRLTASLTCRIVGITGGWLDDPIEWAHDTLGLGGNRDSFPVGAVRLWDVDTGWRYSTSWFGLDSIVATVGWTDEPWWARVGLRLPIDTWVAGVGLAVEVGCRVDDFAASIALGVYPHSELLDTYRLSLVEFQIAVTLGPLTVIVTSGTLSGWALRLELRVPILDTVTLVLTENGIPGILDPPSEVDFGLGIEIRP